MTSLPSFLAPSMTATSAAEAVRKPMPQALDRAFDETGEGNAGALVHRLLDILLADTVARQRRRMLGTENEKRPGREDDVIVSQTRHGANDVLQNVGTGFAAISEDIL